MSEFSFGGETFFLLFDYLMNTPQKEFLEGTKKFVSSA